ncbi:MAG: YidH family protein [Gammaproteobacteria bacterium]
MPEQETYEQIKLLQQRLIQLSAERTYMNTERTLSVWIRTALGLMIFGIAIDRFGLLLHGLPWLPHGHLHRLTASAWGGALLVALGVLMVLAMDIRFLAYASIYRRSHEWPVKHGPYLAATFASLVAVFGIILLIIMLVFTE